MKKAVITEKFDWKKQIGEEGVYEKDECNITYIASEMLGRE